MSTRKVNRQARRKSNAMRFLDDLIGLVSDQVVAVREFANQASVGVGVGFRNGQGNCLEHFARNARDKEQGHKGHDIG